MTVIGFMGYFGWCVVISLAITTTIQTIRAIRRDIFQSRDAARWRMIDLLRDRHGSVEIYCEDHVGGAFVKYHELDGSPRVFGIRNDAATIDVALAQALNAERQA